jgi:hypothetical protein|tara:strand:+ start:197 stop:610 length:414 start_codon:yes stop_codon:yes gene_type:complete
MVIGKITSYLALGLVGAFLLNTIIRPTSALGTGAALQETGIGISSIGKGIGDSLRSIGQGSAKLLDPLFSLRDLVYSADVSGAANVSPVAQNEGETNYAVSTPSSSTITWSSGTTASVPSLSPAAKSYYRSLGVSVT